MCALSDDPSFVSSLLLLNKHLTTKNTIFYLRTQDSNLCDHSENH